MKRINILLFMLFSIVALSQDNPAIVNCCPCGKDEVIEGCLIENLVAVASCNGSDADITITYDFSGSTTQLYEINGNGTVAPITSGQTISVTGAVGQTITIAVRDDANGKFCFDEISLTLPDCGSCNCEITGIVQVGSAGEHGINLVDCDGNAYSNGDIVSTSGTWVVTSVTVGSGLTLGQTGSINGTQNQAFGGMLVQVIGSTGWVAGDQIEIDLVINLKNGTKISCGYCIEETTPIGGQLCP